MQISAQVTYIHRAIKAFFDSHTFSKGERYFEQGRVRSCSKSNHKVFGIVSGSDDYDTLIVLNADEDKIAMATCSCPLGGYCKHSVALGLKYASLLDDAEKNYADSREIVLDSLSMVSSEQTNRSSIRPARNHSDERSTANLDRELESKLNRLKFFAERDAEKTLPKPKKKTSNAKIVYTLGARYGFEPSLSALKINILANGKEGAVTELGIPNILKSTAQFITPEDLEIAQMFNTMACNDWSLVADQATIYNNPNLLHLMITRVSATGRFYLVDDLTTPLKLGEKLPGRLHWLSDQDGGQRLCIVAVGQDVLFPCVNWRIPWYLDTENYVLGPLDFPLNPSVIECILDLPPVSKADAEKLLLRLPLMGLEGLIPFPRTERNLRKIILEPKPHIELAAPPVAGGMPPTQSFPIIKFSNRYEQNPSAVPVAIKDDLVIYERNAEQEGLNCRNLAAMGFEAVDSREENGVRQTYFSAQHPQPWLKLSERMGELKTAGWDVSNQLIEKLTPIEADEADLNLQVNEENNWWFSLALNIDIDGKKKPLLPLLLSAIRSLPNSKSYSIEAIDQLNHNGKFKAMLEDGRLLSLPFNRIKPILISMHELFFKDASMSIQGDKLKVSLLDAASMLEGEDESAEANSIFSGAGNIADLARRFRNLAVETKPVVSKSLNAQLREYQECGLAWFQKLAEQKFGGILADDMGLGKTVQLLAFLTAAKDAQQLKGRPFLVICPKSVLPNWKNECAKFASGLKVLVITGQNREEDLKKITKHDLIVTSYALALRDIKALNLINWRGVALDESQAIKNSETKIAKAILTLKADYRFCLTGTPIENHLGELWSQFRFLLPGFLGDKTEFKQLFQTPIEKENDLTRRSMLVSRVKPFILRRTKDEVAKDLPEKSVMIQNVEIEGAQLDLYETVRLSMTKQVRDEVAKKGFKSSQIIILDALLKLRQVCCDPRLVKLSASKKAAAESAKLEMLMEMLRELQTESRKVLVFSQFTSMLDLIAEELNKEGIRYVELRGDTNNREKPVHEFQNTDVPVFLLSLKAGGTGLNLTAADVVIHYDPWWNPAAEDQATDRAHRIGQTKKVFVYKLVVKGSIEERMLQLQERKKALAASIYENGGSSGRLLEENDIEMLLSPIGHYGAE